MRKKLYFNNFTTFINEKLYLGAKVIMADYFPKMAAIVPPSQHVVTLALNHQEMGSISHSFESCDYSENDTM